MPTNQWTPKLIRRRYFARRRLSLPAFSLLAFVVFLVCGGTGLRAQSAGSDTKSVEGSTSVEGSASVEGSTSMQATGPNESPNVSAAASSDAAASAERVSGSLNLPMPVATSDEVAQINRLVQKTLGGYEIKPSRNASEGEWCRRVFLDLVGRIPSRGELKQFLGDRDDDKHYRLVTRLVYGDQYASEFARNWTTIFTNMLVGRTGGNGRNPAISRVGLESYLREAWLGGTPYNQLVHELLTATGTTTPDMEGFNGAVNFLAGKVREDKAAQATSDTARIFLGQQIQCVQCHNHPFNDWKQEKFWQLNAFFRQARFQRGEESLADGGFNSLMDKDFAGENRRRRNRADRPPAQEQNEDAEIFFEMRNGLMKVAYPVFIDGTEIDRSGWVSDVNRREQLANLVTESEWLGKSISNRIWGHFLGYGFTKPVDDMGPHNPPSHPELLDYLATQLRSVNYDLRSLMVWITLSEAYGRSSRTTSGNRGDDPMLGELPKFSHFYIRQMAPEQLYESLLLLNRDETKAMSSEKEDERKARWLRQFARSSGNDEGSESTSFNGTIPQTLSMFNGEMTRKAIRSGGGTFLASVVKSGKSDAQRVDSLFLSGLGRRANRNERKMASQLLASYGDKPLRAYEDLWWVILNSNEFILNH